MSCINNGAFISESQIQMEAQKITVVDDEYSSNETLFEDIKFNCNGYIMHMHVVIGTKNLSSTLNLPEIHLWICYIKGCHNMFLYLEVLFLNACPDKMPSSIKHFITATTCITLKIFSLFYFSLFVYSYTCLSVILSFWVIFSLLFFFNECNFFDLMIHSDDIVHSTLSEASMARSQIVCTAH